MTFEEIKLNIDTHIAQIKDVEIKLTRTEYAILKLLMQNQTQVVSKSHLLDHISEDTPDCTESSLKTHISNLRKKTSCCKWEKSTLKQFGESALK